MKKLFFILLCLILNYTLTFAAESDKIKISETDFSQNCYEYYSEIPKGTLTPGEIFQYSSQYHEPVFIQGEYLLHTQHFSIDEKKYNYSSSEIHSFEYLNDLNKNTSIEIDTSINNILNLDFGEFISDKNLMINFDYSAKYHGTSFSISADGKQYTPLDINDIQNYGFQYIRINFFRNVKHVAQEKIIIKEISFSNSNFNYVVANNSNQKIQIFASNKCSSTFSNIIYSKDLPSNLNTQKISSYFEENPSLVANPENDSDNDGTLDKHDNCPLIYNPLQQDTNSNGIGDLCADDDRDNIYGNKDNCVNTYNPDQKDINRNNVGDLCEFDADKDGIYDSIDNCRNIANISQGDTDNDNIGNSCDNCNLYNPSQLDENQNGVGDICEKTETHLIENDDDKDGIINYKDNCRYISNPDQQDSDKDNIGNSCDNCKDIQNSKQIDKNENGVGDMCEDSDNDTIQGYLDNCINITNTDQGDDDNNGIGNKCEDTDYDKVVFIHDNCPFKYNPDQADIDKDNIGDVCDNKDDRYIESNKTFFIGLLIVIVAIFGVGIFSMLRKLQ